MKSTFFDKVKHAFSVERCPHCQTKVKDIHWQKLNGKLFCDRCHGSVTMKSPLWESIASYSFSFLLLVMLQNTLEGKIWLFALYIILMMTWLFYLIVTEKYLAYTPQKDPTPYPETAFKLINNTADFDALKAKYDLQLTQNPDSTPLLQQDNPLCCPICQSSSILLSRQHTDCELIFDCLDCETQSKTNYILHNDLVNNDMNARTHDYFFPACIVLVSLVALLVDTAIPTTTIKVIGIAVGLTGMAVIAIRNHQHKQNNKKQVSLIPIS